VASCSKPTASWSPPGQRSPSTGSATSGGTLDFALARYRPDGRLDRRCGTHGITVTDLGGSDVANALAVQRDGKVVLTGATVVPPGSPDAEVAVARYHVLAAGEILGLR